MKQGNMGNELRLPKQKHVNKLLVINTSLLFKDGRIIPKKYSNAIGAFCHYQDITGIGILNITDKLKIKWGTHFYNVP